MHLFRSKYGLMLKAFKRLYSTRLSIEKYDLKSTRNIGIIAHIDAGKTTTTERMLYYSGQTEIMGEVHDGDTVMDYLAQERERGITITSASITFGWKRHRINLIDTPGHVDFTIEVERSLSVLDGAVCILDASAGVEAQTYTVWSQADRYNIPRIIYLNKMDKPFANMSDCVKSVEQKLGVKPLAIHIPIGEGKSFRGVIDLILMEKIVWPQNDINEGRYYTSSPLESSDQQYRNVCQMREQLIGSMSELDEKLAEDILTTDKIENISVQSLQNALRRITFKQLAFPILCGSSYRNTGVQLLLDSILRYFPNPIEKVREITQLYGQKLCAFAFKIIFDKRLGCLTFLRIYSGEIKNMQSLYNINREKQEKVSKLFIAFADDFQEVSHISHGNIAVVAGLVHTITGDTLVFSSDVANEVSLNSHGLCPTILEFLFAIV
jgi:elongation factor G